ncbi:monovalent cation/H+ antiporter subunit D [Paracandidimonas soli]|uniref:monovalent cation/H+ antiporter subunit D n=1 Tax=Paracandidimonas soli TaxID=1917182 RepID=UPI00333E63EB
MTGLLHHLPILPVAIPLFAGALMLLQRDSQRNIKGVISLASLLAQIVCAVMLLLMSTGQIESGWAGNVGVYLLGNWSAPFGIVVVADRLSTAMLLLTSLLGFACWVYATARWERAGVHFDPLFQFLLMGLNGAFLTGDLFNLFVFFEVLLAASYGLILHGSGAARVSASLHYIAVNLVASFLLLIAIALIYGVTGTLNMADLSVKAGLLDGAERSLFEAGAAILGVAFLVKAAAWPLNFWLPAAYGNAAAPVAGVFAIMTKVGIYSLLRIGSLLDPNVAPAAFGGEWMFPVGIATLVFGGIGMLATQQAERLSGYAVIMSSGTLLAAFGMPGTVLTGPGLFYMSISILTMGAMFMLLEMVERTQTFGADLLAISMEAFDLEDPESPDRSDDVVGVPMPAVMTFLGLSFFACALLIIGLPPLSGFVAKFTMLSAALQAASSPAATLNAWIFIGAVLVSGLAGIIALCRTGIRLFWNVDETVVPKLRLNEAVPVAMLLLTCAALTFWAGPVMQYFETTAKYLGDTSLYVNAVLQQTPIATDAAIHGRGT